MKTEMEIKLKQEIKRAFSYNLKYWLNKRNLKQIDLVNRLHLSKSTVSQWLNPNSRKMPSTTTLNKIAEILDVDLSDLLEDNVASFKFSDVENIAPLPRTKRRPRLGVIACGEPILAQENIEDYDDVPEDMQCDFTLICQGDSMTGARINEGDIVYIKEQPIVDNGEIAACRVDGEFDSRVTLKRFFKYDDRVVLQSENPQYPPFVYIKEEMNKVHILGKAVGFTSKL
jgi:repressor LexA